MIHILCLRPAKMSTRTASAQATDARMATDDETLNHSGAMRQHPPYETPGANARARSSGPTGSRRDTDPSAGSEGFLSSSAPCSGSGTVAAGSADADQYPRQPDDMGPGGGRPGQHGGEKCCAWQWPCNPGPGGLGSLLPVAARALGDIVEGIAAADGDRSRRCRGCHPDRSWGGHRMGGIEDDSPLGQGGLRPANPASTPQGSTRHPTAVLRSSMLRRWRTRSSW